QGAGPSGAGSQPAQPQDRGAKGRQADALRPARVRGDRAGCGRGDVHSPRGRRRQWSAFRTHGAGSGADRRQAAKWTDRLDRPSVPVRVHSIRKPGQRGMAVNGSSIPAASERLILVVDDDEHTRNLLRDLCEALTFKVALAEDGSEAIAKLADFKPDLMLLDL